MLIKFRDMRKRKENQKGFTLVELIVVMAILAILAGIAVPKFSDVLTQSKFKTHNSNVDMIGNAARIYVTDYQSNSSTPMTGATNDITSNVLKGVKGSTSSDGTTYSLSVPYTPNTGMASKYTINYDATTDKITVKPGKLTPDASGKYTAPSTTEPTSDY